MGNYDIQGLDELVNRTILQGPYIDKSRLENNRRVDELVNRTILQGPYIDKSRLKNSLVTKQLLTNYAIEELMFT